jgi:class 3 adenylate cyclase/predicted ATPase
MTSEHAKPETTDATKQWLAEAGLSQYTDIFLEHQIRLDVLPQLNEADLVELGIPLGDRKRLLRAIGLLADRSGGERSVARRKSSGLSNTGAERRQLTVMFCDMVGSTALSEQFDPEEFRDIIAAYRETCARVIERYEGYVARYVGDGILVYFGYPGAHEDDAERAVRASLEIAQTISSQAWGSRPPSGDLIAVRIGIATGLVVVGDVVSERTEEHDSAVGETPNLAARLQALASPNSVVVAASTRSLLRGKFEYQDLGSIALKGITASVPAWQVVRPTGIESRFAPNASLGFTPLVNRAEEIALLRMRWQQADAGDGQVILLLGEPGIGKSRIIQELCDRIEGAPPAQISFQCLPYYTSTPFHPFVQYFKAISGFDREGAPEVVLDRLETALAATTPRMEFTVPLIAALLSLPTGNRYPSPQLSPQRQKDATILALVEHFLAQARARPTLIVVEDAHWIDPSSGEVLDLLVERVQEAPVLMIITCRPEFQPSWSAHSHITRLTLNRLSRQLRATMVASVAAGKALPEDVVKEIVIKTDGIPLFVEELTKAVLELNVLREQDSRPLRQLAIPATLADSLMARLDRMGSFKEVAQIGATIGRDFSYELLRAVAEAPAGELTVALNHLEGAGLIIRRGSPPQAVYAFKHALVQDAAHSSLLRSDRKRLHARIAAVLNHTYPEKVEHEPELLAHHLTEAGESVRAVDFWLKAGRSAAKTRANLEAIGHLQRGLEVLAGDPSLADRDGKELALRIGLGVPLIAAKGYAVPEVEQNFMRALQLGKRLDKPQEIFAATRGLWVCYFIRADLAKAYELSDQLLKLAERTRLEEGKDPQATGYLIEAHRALGQTMLYRGEFVGSGHHFESGIALYDIDLHGSLVENHGIDPGIVCLSYLGYLKWFLGHGDEAQKYSDQALCNAERIRHPFTLAFASTFRAYLSQHLRDAEQTRKHASKAVAVASDHGFLHWKYQATMLQGWALVELGRLDDGLQQIRAGLEAYEGMGAWLACSWFRSLLANAYARVGEPVAALRALDAARSIVEKTGERFYLAEIYRLQGAIALQHRGLTAAGEAELCYRRSLDVCREQAVRAWELRTSVSLARLYQDLDRPQEAARLLVPLCGDGKQDQQTQDVKEAMDLLRALPPSAP